MLLIDPPVSPLSTASDIADWLSELEELEAGPEVEQAIQQARAWLASAEANARVQPLP